MLEVLFWVAMVVMGGVIVALVTGVFISLLDTNVPQHCSHGVRAAHHCKWCDREES